MVTYTINTINPDQTTYLKETFDLTAQDLSQLYDFINENENKNREDKRFVILTSDIKVTCNSILILNKIKERTVIIFSKNISDEFLNTLTNKEGREEDFGMVKDENILLYGLDRNEDELFLDRDIYQITSKRAIKYPEKTEHIFKVFLENNLPIHLEIDANVLDNKQEIADFMKIIYNVLGENVSRIQSLGVHNYDPSQESERLYKMRAEIIKQILKRHPFNMTENRINIFNENTEFLIFRPCDQIDEDDIGWYILRGMDNEMKNRIMSQLDSDSIVTFTIEDEDYYITKTTINEQNKKSYNLSKKSNLNILDTCLYPEEKMDMGFELIS